MRCRPGGRLIVPDQSLDFGGLRALFIMTWNLMHLARMLRAGGGIPAYGNVRSGWDAGCRHDFTNPEYR